MAEELSQDLIAWIEKVASGRVVSAARHFAGASREAWNVDVALDGGEAQPLFLLRDQGKGGGSARDANVLRALADSPIPVPRVVGFDEQTATILLTRLSGRSDFPAVDHPGEREPTAQHLMMLTAELHRLDLSTLSIPHLDQPTESADSARPAIEQTRGAVEILGEGADPFFTFALDWLETNMPEGMRGDSLVHSDMGPGNFLSQGGRVTGIVDWEVAHFGDPMEDLAAIAVRDMATPIGDLRSRLREYEEAGGPVVDLQRVHYFRLLILVRNSVMIGLGLAHPAPGFDVLEMTMFQTLLMRAAALVLCDNLGIARPSVDDAGRGECADSAGQASVGEWEVHPWAADDRRTFLAAIQQDLERANQEVQSQSEDKRGLHNVARGVAALAHAGEVESGLGQVEREDLSVSLREGEFSGEPVSWRDLEQALRSQASRGQEMGAADRERWAAYFARRFYRIAELRKPLMGELYARLPQPLPTDAEWKGGE